MKLRLFTLSIIVILSFSSCIEHEVIPPPKQEVELSATFIGDIDGITIEYVENVNGMYSESTVAKEILTNQQPSSATYYSEMKSNEILDYLQVGIGKVSFQSSITSSPSLSQFESFFVGNTMPNYATAADGGVEIVYRDAFGEVWKSDISNPDPQAFEFTYLEQASDASGDYMKFEAQFNCKLYNFDLTNFITLENGVYKAFFKRQ